MRSTHLLTISSQAALSEADCTASRSDRLMHCKSFLTTSIHLRRGRPRGRRMSVVLIDIRRAWKEDDSSPSLTTWPNHSSLRCLQTWDSGVCSVLAYSAIPANPIPVFSDDNLKLNVAKTQYFTVTKKDDSWKSVKLLGSMLGTAEDIAARVSAANRAFAGIPWKRHNLNSRLCMFSCLILPVLLYNCALWTLSQTLTDVVNVWHRKKLRTIIGITYPQRISNTALYARTEQTPL